MLHGKCETKPLEDKNGKKRRPLEEVPEISSTSASSIMGKICSITPKKPHKEDEAECLAEMQSACKTILECIWGEIQIGRVWSRHLLDGPRRSCS
jgi:hypothetical protein